MYPESIKNLIESFKCFPGIGEKTAERLAFSVLDLEEEQVEFFSSSLLDVSDKIHKCKKCNTLTDNELCYICSDSNSKSVFLFEKFGIFHGKYHVLEGLISPLDGINPEDIGIGKLLDRIHDENFVEIVFAFKPSIEGETTTLYIKRTLDDLGIKTTRLASGIPIGADMEYLDKLTLERAMSDRKSIE